MAPLYLHHREKVRITFGEVDAASIKSIWADPIDSRPISKPEAGHFPAVYEASDAVGEAGGVGEEVWGWGRETFDLGPWSLAKCLHHPRHSFRNFGI